MTPQQNSLSPSELASTDQNERARKREAIGLSSTRPTAKSVVQRPPDASVWRGHSGGAEGTMESIWASGNGRGQRLMIAALLSIIAVTLLLTIAQAWGATMTWPAMQQEVAAWLGATEVRTSAPETDEATAPVPARNTANSAMNAATSPAIATSNLANDNANGAAVATSAPTAAESTLNQVPATIEALVSSGSDAESDAVSNAAPDVGENDGAGVLAENPPAAQNGTRLLLAEDFSTRRLPLAETVRRDEWRTELLTDEGLYRMEAAAGYAAWAPLETRSLGAIQMTVEMTVAADNPDGYGGFLARYQNDETLYLFLVDGERRFQVQQRVDGEWTTRTGWTQVGNLNEAGTSNRLSLLDDGVMLRFLGNDVLLHQIKDVQLPAGDAGFVSGSLGNGTARVDFDNLRIYSVNP